jgi:hypothetical protein
VRYLAAKDGIAVYEPGGAEESFVDLDDLAANRGAENRDELGRLNGTKRLPCV